ncbi:MAG TPA: hypothetical protein VGE98_05600 [Thermoanaerobaculia bacterium]
MQTLVTPLRLFLLSPANTSGKRAARWCDPAFVHPQALALRDGGLPVGDAFSHLSTLYFRGKIAYARRFAAHDADVLVIAPGFGLVPPSWSVTLERLEAMRATRVDLEDSSYTAPMVEHCAALAGRLPASAEIVLLGSLATGKYLDLLTPAFGDRLRVPRAFVGAGEMQRGSLLLRAVRAGEEREYVRLPAVRG